MTDVQENPVAVKARGAGTTDDEWADRINHAFGQGVGWIIATGRECMACRQEKGDEGWQAFASSGKLQFKLRQAQTFMRIAMQAELLDQSLWPVLPHAIRPLYQLTRLSNGMLPKLIEYGFINPDMTEEEAKPSALAKRLNEVVAVEAQKAKERKAKEQKSNGYDPEDDGEEAETVAEAAPAEQKPAKRKRKAQQKTENEKKAASEKKERVKADRACDELIGFIDGHHTMIAALDLDLALSVLSAPTSRRLYKLADEAVNWWQTFRRLTKPKEERQVVTTRFKKAKK